MSRGARYLPGALARLPLSTFTLPLAVASLVTAAPARAEPAASLTSVTLPSVGYSHHDRTSSGRVTLTVTDDTAGDLGWHVTVESTDLVYSGDFHGEDIPASKLAVTAVEDPTRTSGHRPQVLGR